MGYSHQSRDSALRAITRRPRDQIWIKTTDAKKGPGAGRGGNHYNVFRRVPRKGKKGKIDKTADLLGTFVSCPCIDSDGRRLTLFRVTSIVPGREAEGTATSSENANVHALRSRLSDQWEAATTEAIERLHLEATGRAPKRTVACPPRVPAFLSARVSLRCTDMVTLSPPLSTTTGPLASKGLFRLYVVYEDDTPLYVGRIDGAEQSIARHINQYHTGLPYIGGAGSDTNSLHQDLRDATKRGRIKIVGIDWYSTILQESADVNRSLEGLLRAVVKPKYHNPKIATFEEDEADAL